MQKLDELLEHGRSLPPQSYPARPTSEPSKGIPPGRESDTFDSFDLELAPEMREPYEQCRKVAAGEAWCAFLLGPTGNGKTHLAIAALQETDGYFWKAPDLLAFLRRRIDVGDADDIVDRYRESTALLVLDDLGVENPTEWAHEQLYRILDARSDRRAPTIITSNQHKQGINERIRSRYREGYVACAGKDQRG